MVGCWCEGVKWNPKATKPIWPRAVFIERPRSDVWDLLRCSPQHHRLTSAIIKLLISGLVTGWQIRIWLWCYWLCIIGMWYSASLSSCVGTVAAVVVSGQHLDPELFVDPQPFTITRHRIDLCTKRLNPTDMQGFFFSSPSSRRWLHLEQVPDGRD